MIKLPHRAFAGLVLAGAALLFNTSKVQAQNADVKLNITLNPITILYYYSTVNVTIPSAVLADFLCATSPTIYNTSAGNCDRGASAALIATKTGGTVQADGAITAPAFNTAAIPLVLQNVWSVRALGGSTGNTTVQITAGAGINLVSGAASIGLSNFKVQSLPVVAGGTVTFADPGLGTARSGDVTLDLNLTNASVAGTYSSGVGVVNYVLTISGT